MTTSNSERDAIEKHVGLIIERVEQYYMASSLGMHPDEAKEKLTDYILSQKAKLYPDLAAAMGHMEGCGHTYPYLTKRYPELAGKGNKEKRNV